MPLDARQFVQAPLRERAVLLLTSVFPGPHGSVNRVDCANAIAAQAADTQPPGVVGGQVIGGRATGDAQDVLRVSEAWQVLEQARLISRDLTQRQGDFWELTRAGHQVRGSSDIDGEIGLRTPGGF